MRYEVTLLGTGKYVTAIIYASSIRQLAETILEYHPGTSLVSCKENPTTSRSGDTITS